MDINVRQAKAIFIQRYATAEEWKTKNPILYPGEIGIESNTGKIKVGREISMPWNSIDYVNSTPGETGEDGKSIFIRYSFSPDGTNYTEEWSLGQNYLGIAIGHEAPNNKEDYEWHLFASNVSEPTAIILSADGWEDNLQIVNVPGIGSNSGVFATAHPDNLELYIQNGIFLEEASFGKATFSCAIVPTVDIKANIIIIEPVIDGDALPDFSESEDKSVLAYIDGEPRWVQINDFPELRGAAGPKGDTGEAGADGVDGADGVGITSIQKTGTVGLVDTYTIYFSNETITTFEVTNGAQGDSGSVETIIVDTAEDLPITATDGSMAVILEVSGENDTGANVIFADSVEELPDPSTVPEDTVALVPSSGGDGLPFVTTDDDDKVPVVKDGKWTTDYIENIISSGGAGGACSWNNLEDRPFYDETYTGTMSFQYNGDPTGKTTVVIPDEGTLVKTSDWTAEPSELIGATGTFGVQSVTITEEMIVDMRGYGMPCTAVAESMFIVYSPFTAEGITFPESGTYIADMGVSASLTVTGTLTRVKTLDPKYLPSGYGGGSGASNVHVLDIGGADLDLTTLDLSAYANGDVLVIVQNMSQ